MNCGRPEQRDGTLRDVHGQIAHAFQIAVDLDGGGEKAQIARHGLMQGQQPGGEFVDLDIELVDALFGLPDVDHQGVVALDQRADAVVDGGLDQTAHFQDLVL